MSSEAMRAAAARYRAGKESGRMKAQMLKVELEIGVQMFEVYKGMPDRSQEEFRRLMEEDWREHRKFDADPSEEIIEAEVIEE